MSQAAAGTNLVAQLVFPHRRTGAAVSGWTPGRGAWLAIRIKVCGLRVAGWLPMLRGAWALRPAGERLLGR